MACDQLYTLSQTDTSAFNEVQKPNLFLISVVLTAQLPLWSPTSIMRGVNQRYARTRNHTRNHTHTHDTPCCVDETFPLRLLSQCTEYFDLRCQLLDDLTSELPSQRHRDDVPEGSADGNVLFLSQPRRWRC